jgi:hypothetical protein
MTHEFRTVRLGRKYITCCLNCGTLSPNNQECSGPERPSLPGVEYSDDLEDADSDRYAEQYVRYAEWYGIPRPWCLFMERRSA